MERIDERAPVLVTGGTGTIGRHVVRQLRDAGHPVRVLSRHRGQVDLDVEWVECDLLSPEGLGRALSDVATIIHCAGAAKGDEQATQNLVTAAERTDVEHFVHVSVVGADRIEVAGTFDRAMFGYFAAKAEAERRVERGGIGWSGLRSCQCHELLAKVAKMLSRLPVVPYPQGFCFQPIAASEVAAVLVRLALGKPTYAWAEIGGPEVVEVSVLLAEYFAANHLKRLAVPMPMFGRSAACFRRGGNLAHSGEVGDQSWSRFLGQQSVE